MGKFGGLLNNPERDDESTPSDAAPSSASVEGITSPTRTTAHDKGQSSGPQPARKMGRPAGKRGTAKTIQVTAYIEESTHIQAKMKLLRDRGNTGSRLDFSGLVQQLLSDWLGS